MSYRRTVDPDCLSFLLRRARGEGQEMPLQMQRQVKMPSQMLQERGVPIMRRYYN
jgi:hypothetical protein